MNIVNKKNRLFQIDDSFINSKNKTLVKNELYLAIYKEFYGAIENPKYRHLSASDKMKALNEFAENWLKDRKILNVQTK